MSEGNKGLNILSRLFKRKQGGNFTAELHARAINKPLFIQADLGAQLINAYLHGPQPQQAIEGDRISSMTVRTENGIAIMDISGALTSRPVYSWCYNQVSYEQIREELAEQVTDANTKAIVLRLDTPGGEASQNIDLHDFIYSMRGDKPIIAMVDDSAYSAGYGIASACDEIWVTRTSGVGSVGVVTYHVDQSDFNNKLGIKVEFIHAGARKVDRNPHEPLADIARTKIQADIDHLYGMFCEAVARGRGLTVEQVMATEASTYIGVKAIEAGFADVLGTFADLLAYLDGGQKPAQPQLTQQAEPQAEPEPQADSGESPELPTENEEADDSEGIGAGTTIDKAAAVLAEPTAQAVLADQAVQTPQPTAEQLAEQQETKIQAEIRAVCTAAGLPEVAADYITARTSLNQVREDLQSMLQAGEVEIESSQKVAVTAPQGEQTANKVTASSVYARRNNRK